MTYPTKLFIFFVLFIILLFAFHLGNTQQHELVHQAIFESYNISSEIKIIYNPLKLIDSQIAGYTIAKNVSLCNETCRMLTLQNEIVGYNILSIESLMVFIVFLLLIFYFMFIHEKIGGIQ